jgi:hypothetical protein
MPDERAAAEQVGAFWDALVLGHDTADLDVDADLSAAIRHVHDLSATPPTSARERVWRAVQTTADASQPESGAPVQPSFPFSISRPAVSTATTRSPSFAWGTRTRWALVQMFTALLVLATVGVSFFLLGSGRTPLAQRSDVPSLILAPATPVPEEQATRTLAAITLPTGAIPSQIGGGLNHNTIPAGTSSSTDSTWISTCCTGLRLDYVLTGSFTMRNEGPVQLLPAGTSTWETITAKTEITLNPGDAILLRMQDAFAAENTNATPVELVEGVLFEGTVNDDPIPQGWVYHDHDIVHRLIPVPSRPVTLRLLEATLDPGAALPLPPGAVLQLAVTLDTQATVGTRGDFDKRNLGKAPVALYVLTLEPAEVGVPPGGTPSP